MEQKLREALIDEMRTALVKKNDVQLKGLGTFKLVHEKQHQKQYKDGQVVLMPPQDKIEFIPEEN